ncbi:MAG: SiaB family protein kinase [Bacteroidia bacterium]
MEKTSIHNVYDVYRSMCDNDLSIIYEGQFDQEITKAVLSLVERNFSENDMDELTKKRIFNIIVEVLQNICKHQGFGGADPAIFIVGKQENDFSIISGNNLQSSGTVRLSAMLDNINGKDKEGLKQLYKEAKLNSVISDVGGAGLGFIDIARKSGNKLSYCIKRMDEEKSFFIFKSVVSNQKQE